MLEKALLDIARRASLRGRRAPISAAAASVNNPKSHDVAVVAQQTRREERHRAHNSDAKVKLLEKVEGDYDAAQRQAVLESRLAAMDEESARSKPLTSLDLVEALQHLPFTFALEASNMLLRAGRVEEALQLITAWRDDVATSPLQRPLSLRAKARASRELNTTVHTLLQLRDAPTLRVVAEMLDASLKEQTALADASADSRACVGCSTGEKAALCNYRLTAPLGARRTYVALTAAVDALCKLTPEDGVLVHEKVAWLGKASRACASLSPSALSATAVMPYRLQRTFSEVVETDAMYSEELARNVNPRFLSFFRHPTQLDVQTILSLPQKEVKAMTEDLVYEKNKQAGEQHGLLSLVARFLSRSQTLRVAERNTALLTALVSHRAPASKETAVREARSALVASLTSRNAAERRAISGSLLRRRHLLRTLQLSPVAVLTAYGESFYSIERANATLSRLVFITIPLLVRRGRTADAARLAWNHLSTDCPTTVHLLQTRPRTMDYVTVAICRTMRSPSSHGGQKDTWMAHRSLALLRVAAAAGAVTPTHVMATCACALDQGASFAAVNELVGEIYNPNGDEKSSDMAKWVLNCIRICAASHDEQVRVRLARRSLPKRVKEFMRSWCPAAAAVAAPSSPSVHFTSVLSPTRSKQLALWSLANDPAPNPCLLSLTTALFVDPAARDAFLNGDFLVNELHNGPVDHQEPLPHKQRCHPQSQCDSHHSSHAQHASGRFQAWEVAASVASNCTSDYTYAQMVRALSGRPALAPSAMSDVHLHDRLRLHRLLQTEIDGYGEKPLGKDDAAHSVISQGEHHRAAA